VAVGRNRRCDVRSGTAAGTAAWSAAGAVDESSDRGVRVADDVPDDLLYTADHEWVRDLGGGRVRIGITNFAQDSLGDIVFVSLPAVDDAVTAGDAIGELESTKSVSELISPVTGTVVVANAALDLTPELVNSDPYGQGWMVEVEVATLPGDLLDAESYREVAR